MFAEHDEYLAGLTPFTARSNDGWPCAGDRRSSEHDEEGKEPPEARAPRTEGEL